VQISGILLAAGESVRMGEPKALLKVNDDTVIRLLTKEYVSSKLAELIIVINPTLKGVYNVLAEFSEKPQVKIIENKDFKKGMFSSVKAGINASSFDIILLGLVDNPLIKKDMLDYLIENYIEGEILIPVYKGKKGHPVVFSGFVKRDILEADYEKTTLQDIFMKNSERIRLLKSIDESVIIDMDYKEDYERVKELWKK